MSSPWSNGGSQPRPGPRVSRDDTWLATSWDAETMDRIERKLDRLATVVYLVIGSGVLVWAFLNLVLPALSLWVIALTGPQTPT